MQSLRDAVHGATGRVHTALAPTRAQQGQPAPQAVKQTCTGPRLDATQYAVVVVGDGARKKQGNCVICQATVLYLCEKQLRVEISRFIDESLEDPLVREVCPDGAKLPLVHALAEDRWLCGSEAIWDYIEEHHKDAPDLGRPVPELSDGVVLGQLAPGMYTDRIFSLLSDALTSKDGARQEAALKELEALLRQLDDWLAEREMAYIGGDAPDGTDCYLVPKLYHAVLALSKLRGWELPEDLQALHRYLVLWRERFSWKESCFDESVAVGFWQRKRESSQASEQR